jgi:hypothetical protein
VPPPPSQWQPQSPFPTPRAPGAVVAIPFVVFGVIFALGIAGFVFTSQRAASKGGASVTGSGMPISQLATLSMKQTPESMAKITGVQVTHEAIGDLEMRVPLSGGEWDSMNVTWDPADPTHAKEVYLYTSATPKDDAAIRQRLLKLLGRRVDKNGNFYWQNTSVSYSGTNARAESSPAVGSTKNPHWKDAMDAAWDALRSSVLNMNVPVTDAELRDWLGRGYSLQSIGAIDPTIDVDHAQATVGPQFPGASSEVSIGLRFTMAVDHPWYGEAELTWANAKGGTLEEAMLRPPPQNENKFTSQADVEACVQAAYGKPYRVYEGDHLKGDHSTEWHPPEGGEVRVYEHMVDVTLSSPFTPKKMTRAGWTHAMSTLDACGKRR